MAQKLLVVDDHPITVEGVLTLLAREPEFEVVGVASTGRQAAELCSERQPDICLIDLMLPDIDGIELAQTLRRRRVDLRVLMYSAAIHQAHVLRAMEAHLDGYLHKAAAATELVQSLRSVAQGLSCFPSELVAAASNMTHRTRLTRREQQILNLIVQGKENPDIALLLSIDLGTVKNHVHHILGKLGAHHRTQAVAIALSQGLINPPAP